ncbi:hypothetical protein E2542_SST27814 [Spatholobus suberectus]|nr:hypothetical protein E2542_SST27814 [Spatholobus suberectus]
MTPSPLLPIATSDDAHAPNLRVLLPYFLGFLSTTISCGIITYLAYTKNDTPMLLFTAFIYVVYFSVDFSPTITITPPPSSRARGRHVRIATWALLSAAMVGSACAFSTLLTLPESLCYFWVVLGGSALLFSAWIGDDRNNVVKMEQYADLVRSFAPIMILFFGLSRRYLTTQLILHAAIMNTRKLVRPTVYCNAKQ